MRILIVLQFPSSPVGKYVPLATHWEILHFRSHNLTTLQLATCDAISEAGNRETFPIILLLLRARYMTFSITADDNIFPSATRKNRTKTIKVLGESYAQF